MKRLSYIIRFFELFFFFLTSGFHKQYAQVKVGTKLQIQSKNPNKKKSPQK